MQGFTSIPETASLISSRSLLLNNDLTCMSQNSGTKFPTTNLQIGMPCFRTDLNTLWLLKDLTPTWIKTSDVTKTYVSQEYVDTQLGSIQTALNTINGV